MSNNQFGIKLEGSRAPIYIYGPWEDQSDLVCYLKLNGLTEVKVAASSGSNITINVDHVVAICGPNDPSHFERIF